MQFRSWQLTPDSQTDSLIQAAIRKAFAHCTLLTIAHRLDTILDSDRILILDQGHIAEFDSPKALLQNPQSALSQMLSSTTEVSRSATAADTTGTTTETEV
eukprot:m.116895 g.116895  ORF g.116895 m.116895 type:complete len:101 (+) comp9195_c0_seq1:1230-1532(+)